jgi:hypothetical protein
MATASGVLYFPRATRQSAKSKKPAAGKQRVKVKDGQSAKSADLFLPRALLVAISFQALPALVLVHLQTTFLFQITHGFAK